MEYPVLVLNVLRAVKNVLTHLIFVLNVVLPDLLLQLVKMALKLKSNAKKNVLKAVFVMVTMEFVLLLHMDMEKTKLLQLKIS